MRRRPDNDGLDGLYRELYPSLVRFSQGIVGSRSDAEDAVHDAFVAAVRSDSVENSRPWLFRVTRNASIDLLRRRRHTVAIEAVADSVADTNPEEPHAAAVMGEQLELIRSALAEMPEKRRSALLLREIAGLPYEEIGRVLDTTEGNVKVLIFRARASLHEVTDAAELECGAVRVALSAAADREVGRVDRASARLHALHCTGCREFRQAITSQHAAIAIIIPAVALPHSLAAAAGGGVMAGFGGAKASIGALLAAATLSAGAGTVVVWSGQGVVGGGRAAVAGHPQAGRPAVAAEHREAAPVDVEAASEPGDQVESGGDGSEAANTDGRTEKERDSSRDDAGESGSGQQRSSGTPVLAVAVTRAGGDGSADSTDSPGDSSGGTDN